MIHTYFDRTFCINLNKRTDRWNEMQVQFKKHNIIAERFSGIEGNKFNYKCKYNDIITKRSFEGQMGCLASHLLIYKKMIDENINIIG